MPIVVGISLRTAGKLYYFDPGTERYLLSERVLVETARGTELGTVKLPPHEVREDQVVPPLKPVIRRATAADISRQALNREREEFALTVCKRLVGKLNLPMRLIDAQYTLDGTHVLIHFLAENRVDFRELVRDLAHELHTRIELRQVGVRDEAKLIGGYGICGQKLCCSAFLGDFAPVAISMAKDQGLALNPQKISGSCGRLMCCLAYECDQYRLDKADLPRLNSTVETPQGVGKVTKLNVLSHQVEVTIADAPAPLWFSVDELTFQGSTHCCAGNKSSRERCQPEDVAPDGTLFMESDVVYIEETMLEAVIETPSPAPQDGKDRRTRSRSRRRRKKSGTGAQTTEGSTGIPPSETSAPGSTAKRPRRRKPQPAQATAVAVAATPVAVPSDGKASPEQGTHIPSGRYRPRRRRRSSSQGSPPQAQ